ncbi:MAG: recombinase family protein [Dehalococcoidia bacterium]
MSTSGNPVRAAGYVRVSDESQVDGLSLDAQRREIERYCEREGHALIHIYADEGVSAHTDQVEHRPQLSSLLSAAREREFDIVVVHTLDRWARNVGVQRQALQRLGEAGVGFASVTERIDFTTPSGRLMLTTLGAVSEFFSDQLGVHVSKAKRERAELGLPVGPIPFGYVAPDDPRTPAAIAPEQGFLVQDAFRRRAQGESYGSIAAWLNTTGMSPSASGKGQVWTAHRVRDLLACDFYRGVVTYKGAEFPGQHVRIVDDDLFTRVQSRKGARAQRRTVSGDRGLLQGRIRCTSCGQTLQSDRTHYGAPMYRERHSKLCPTNNRSIMAAEIDDQIETILTSMQLLPDWLERLAAAISHKVSGPAPAKLKERLRRLARVYSYGDMRDDEYEAARSEIESQLRQTSVILRPAHNEAAALFADSSKLWTRAGSDERRRLVALAFERVYVDLETKLITTIVPTAECGLLLQHALEAAERSDVLLYPAELSEALDALHAYADGERVRAWASDHPSGEGIRGSMPSPAEQLEMVETGEN